MKDEKQRRKQRIKNKKKHRDRKNRPRTNQKKPRLNDGKRRKPKIRIEEYTEDELENAEEQFFEE